MQLGENKIQNYPDRHVKLRPQGVYIITGGIGGIGLEIAKNMSLQEKVHIIFAQRSILPDRSKWDNVDNYGRKIKRAIMAIKEIEENGSSVELFAVDVTNEEQVENLIKLVNEKYATINGIIHAAGLAGVGFLVNKNVDDFKKVVYAKVIGTWLLDDKTRDYNLDFLFCFHL